MTLGIFPFLPCLGIRQSIFLADFVTPVYLLFEAFGCLFPPSGTTSPSLSRLDSFAGSDSMANLPLLAFIRCQKLTPARFHSLSKSLFSALHPDGPNFLKTPTNRYCTVAPD